MSLSKVVARHDEGATIVRKVPNNSVAVVFEGIQHGRLETMLGMAMMADARDQGKGRPSSDWLGRRRTRLRRRLKLQSRCRLWQGIMQKFGKGLGQGFG